MSKDQSQALRLRCPGHPEIPLLLVLSSAALCGGLALPLMSVEKMLFWKNSYSVVTGIAGLFNDGEYFLSAILFFFCLVFPIVKLSMLWMMWWCAMPEARRRRMITWLGLLGKWSMLDVFVVAILIVAVKLGPMASVKPKVGVYIFCAAIILSMATATWIERLVKAEQ